MLLKRQPTVQSIPWLQVNDDIAYTASLQLRNAAHGYKPWPLSARSNHWMKTCLVFQCLKTGMRPLLIACV